MPFEPGAQRVDGAATGLELLANLDQRTPPTLADFAPIGRGRSGTGPNGTKEPDCLELRPCPLGISGRQPLSRLELQTSSGEEPEARLLVSQPAENAANTRQTQLGFVFPHSVAERLV